MNLLTKWLTNKGLTDEKITKINEAFNDFHKYLKDMDMILCEADDKVVAKWIKLRSYNNKNSYYNYFELLSYPIEFYKEEGIVEINFKLTNVYLLLKHKKFRNEMFRLHIDNLLSRFKNNNINFEYKYKFNESNSGLDFILNKKYNVRTVYAYFNEENFVYQFRNDIKIQEYDYLLILCIMNESIKKFIVIPSESFKINDDGIFYKFDTKDQEIFNYEDRWELLKTV